jgi:hypothetical protein
VDGGVIGVVSAHGGLCVCVMCVVIHKPTLRVAGCVVEDDVDDVLVWASSGDALQSCGCRVMVYPQQLRPSHTTGLIPKCFATTNPSHRLLLRQEAKVGSLN